MRDCPAPSELAGQTSALFLVLGCGGGICAKWTDRFDIPISIEYNVPQFNFSS
jgi:hypothetical protein